MGAKIWLRPPESKFMVSALTPLPLTLLWKEQQAGRGTCTPAPVPAVAAQGQAPPSVCMSLILFIK